MGALGGMRRRDPRSPLQRADAQTPPPPVLGQVPAGEGGCTGASSPLGFADPDSGASGVRAAPAGGGGRRILDRASGLAGLGLPFPGSRACLDAPGRRNAAAASRTGPTPALGSPSGGEGRVEGPRCAQRQAVQRAKIKEMRIIGSHSQG